MDLNKTRKSVFIVYFFSVLGFIILLTGSYINLRKADNDIVRLKKTMSKLTALQNISIHIKAIESGQRGFVISGNKDFLNSYYDGVQKIKEDTAFLKLTFASKDARENFYIDCDKEGEYISDLIENGELREDGDRSLIIGPVNDYQKFYKKIISNLEIGKRLKKPVDAADSKFIDDIKNMVERKKRESRKLLAKIEVSQEIEH